MSDHTPGGNGGRNPQDTSKRNYEPGQYGRSERGGEQYGSDEDAADLVAERERMQRGGAAERGETPGEAAEESWDAAEQPAGGDLEQRGVRELRVRARQLHIHNRSKMNKQQLIEAIRSIVR